VSIDGAIGGSEENRCSTIVVDGDIGLEARATIRLLDDVRGVISWQDENPAETDAGGFSGVIQPLFANEM
jgi:hypothetical protein